MNYYSNLIVQINCVNTYFASFAPFGVCKLLTRRAVAVPLGYVSLYFRIITCDTPIEILSSINCNHIYMNEGAIAELCSG